MEGKGRKAHVLIVSSQFAGHCGPFLQIMYMLEAKYPGLTVTYVADEPRVADVTALQRRGQLRNLDIRTEAVFKDVPVYPHDPKFPVRGPISGEKNFHDCQPWRSKLLAQKGQPGQPTVIIADMFQVWSKDLADALGVPWYVYLSTCPLYTLVLLEMPRLRAAGLVPDPAADNQSVVLPAKDFPGFPSIRVRDMTDEAFMFSEFTVSSGEAMRSAAGVLLNTADELDRPAGTLTALRTRLPSTRVMAVGPSLQLPGFGVVYSEDKSTTADEMLSAWLDGQPDGSVLYVAFGTLGAADRAALAALADGIEASGVRFVWALRKGAEFLPAGFQERTAGRGRLELGWVPQTQILIHRATGGFLSHSGWNSTLESIACAKPILSWPLGADQPLTARFIHHSTKVGLAMCYAKGEDHDTYDDIDSGDVEKMIRRLMSNSEEGQKIRKTAQELQKLVATSMAEGGSSYRQLHTLVDDLAAA